MRPMPLPLPSRWPNGSLLDTLSRADQEGLLRLGTLRGFDRNEILLHQGATDRDVLVLLRGCVKIFSSTPTGQVTLLAIRLVGDLLGELAALDEAPRSATVVAAGRVNVRSIGHAEFTAFLHARPAAGIAVQRSITRKLRQANRFRAGAAVASVPIRLAAVLEQLAATLAGRTGRASSSTFH